ncbi:MAG TPA: MFS transporter [Aliidongia sp.]|nr:MFS transporter [Aliidongia sp.]
MSSLGSADELVSARSDASSYRVFWAAWSGWMLDGFDSGLYQFILVAALSDLLPESGIEATKANIAAYGGMLFSIFMLGWACSMFWGWLADRIGRVRTLCYTILAYSIFTACCGLAYSVAVFAIFRFLAGFGIGGEWAAGTPLLHESVPERIRVRLAGWLHTATPTGLTLAALVALGTLPFFGWRGLFMIGVLPAMLGLYLRATLPEPKHAETEKAPISSLFTGAQARSTWGAALMMACVIFGLWSSTFWVPTVVISKLVAEGSAAGHAQSMAALSGVFTNFGTFLGCLAMPWLTGLIGGRKRTAYIFFLGALVTNVFVYLFIIPASEGIVLLFAFLPILGFFTNGIFALYTIWLPELFPSALRGFGSGFAFSLGRILGATGPTIVGLLAARFGGYPIAIALVSLIYLVGLPAISLARETSAERLRD